MFRYFTFLLLLLKPTISLTHVDLLKFTEQYKLKSQKFKLKLIPDKVFIYWADLSMMTRVRNFKQIIGEGSGGFAFLSDYMFPGTDEWIPAAIKIFNENDDKFKSFFSNLVQAELTGDMMPGKFDPEEIGPYSIDKSEKRVQINRKEGVKNPNRVGIGLFYEMQAHTFDIDGKKSYLTTLITEVGVQDMSKELFKSTTSKKKNTRTFLRYVQEMARGAMNINKQKILHGNIKPQNIILVEGDDKQLHPKYIDFDLMLDGTENEFKSNQLRYTEDFRAPWIKKQNGLYKYNEEFKEDTYALAVSIISIYEKNKQYLDRDNGTLKAINYKMQIFVNDKVQNDGDLFPTTNEFLKFIEDKLRIGNKYMIETIEEPSDFFVHKNKKVERKNRELNVEKVKDKNELKDNKPLIVM